MQHLAGVVQDNIRMVMIYETSPSVRDTKVLYEGLASGCDWGPDCAYRPTLALAKIILAQINVYSALLVVEYARQVVRGVMLAGKMWILPLDDVKDWVAKQEVIQ